MDNGLDRHLDMGGTYQNARLPSFEYRFGSDIKNCASFLLFNIDFCFPSSGFLFYCSFLFFVSQVLQEHFGSQFLNITGIFSASAPYYVVC